MTYAHFQDTELNKKNKKNEKESKKKKKSGEQINEGKESTERKKKFPPPQKTKSLLEIRRNKLNSGTQISIVKIFYGKRPTN